MKSPTQENLISQTADRLDYKDQFKSLSRIKDNSKSTSNKASEPSGEPSNQVMKEHAGNNNNNQMLNAPSNFKFNNKGGRPSKNFPPVCKINMVDGEITHDTKKYQKPEDKNE